GLLIIIAGALLDGLDGYLARQSNEVSQRGGFLDSVLDRVADAAFLIGLSLYFHDQGRPLWAGLTLAGLAGTFLVSYVRAKAEQSLAACEVGLGGERPDRLIALIISGLAGYLEVGILYVIVASWLTVARRFLYTWRELGK
ncbi:MAG: CDP-alcohol phosphatidyltransferase family protein, partial [Deltaproteobacteria bacterium]|nr:CDP-alcohol phosphatidyltransferase family protein [Deltaproteobacteria bacterium]